MVYFLNYTRLLAVPPVRPIPTLSKDLIIEILIRVPVKSLVQSQLVCKAWLSLINHPAFVKSQLRHALSTQPHVISPKVIKHETFSLLDVDSRQIVAHLKFPRPRGEVTSVTIVGSANGIVCVAVQFKTTFPVRITDIYLWNPAMRQSKLLPSLFDYESADILSLRALGFGYDEVDHDFKVVVFGVLFPLGTCYAVYSDYRNAWRHISLPEPIRAIRAGTFDVCVNGFLCGMRNKYVMMSFDLNQEVLNCAIKFPVMNLAHAQHFRNCAAKLPVINDDNDHDYELDGEITHVIAFNNSVAVVMLMESNKKINFWTLDDGTTCLRGRGLEASWTPMLSIVLTIPASLIYGYFSNGNLQLAVVMNDVKMLVSCNADKKEARIAPLSVKMADDLHNRVIFKYTESLVSLQGFTDMSAKTTNVGKYSKPLLVLVSLCCLLFFNLSFS
ncbi:putative F-box protein At1g47790 [Daucus carota subsp. sativus]|uniref:putative F-box protein At1g47790 n=1 Tax=Daucus carota subsp. sativus TaxID=79200 RepID=UPI0007F00895|nr:PREDICTED: putative F-box protein At1g47790 [Daucus carota subsp. sativus]